MRHPEQTAVGFGSGGLTGERPFGSSKTKSIGGFFRLSKRTFSVVLATFLLDFRSVPDALENLRGRKLVQWMQAAVMRIGASL
jgi:hypothetical protein